MAHVYIVVHGPSECLVVERQGKLSLPSHSDWPIAKRVPRHWPSHLLKHLTYGLLHARPQKISKAFGLDANLYVYSCDDLVGLVKQCKGIWRWHKYNGFTNSFKLKTIKIDDADALLPVESLHCLRHWQKLFKTTNDIGCS